MARKLFLHTFGCQANEADSARMREGLAKEGWVTTETAEDADLVLLNTCAIREKSEQKLLSALGRYAPLKRERGTKIGVGGCVAQQEKHALLKKVPYVDFVFGPDQIGNLPAIVKRVEAERVRLTETAWLDASTYVFPTADPSFVQGKVTTFVTVMKGCNNVCAFCVVPHTRGREVSRPVGEVLAEIRALAEVGVREVTLIGQNVNSYAGGVDFATLLRQVARVPGVERIRFTTSHPHDLSDALCDVFADEPRLMPHFHLPVQSGSDRVLKRMRRDYTVEEYLGRLARLRAARADIAVTTDVIVAYPGESDDDFERTMELLERVQYANAYSFVFSPRPNTSASRHLGEPGWEELPREVGVQRVERVQALIRDCSLALNRAALGRTVEVLVEGPSRYEPTRRYGKTGFNQVVNFEGTAETGRTVLVHVDDVTANSLTGTEASALPPATGPTRLQVVG